MKRAPHRGVAIGALALALAGPGCARPTTPPVRPLVVVSVPPQAFFVEKIAGERVDVEVMLPPGASPASYEPSVGQMRELARAVLYVKVGHPHFPFERAWLEPMLRQHAGLTVLDGSAGIARLEGDPHVWVSPRCARTMARNIADALGQLLPGDAPALRANLERLLGEIDALDAEIRTRLAPRSAQRFYVFHPAWGYFAEEFGLEQVAIEHDGKQPSPGELSAWIRDARAQGARVIFVQPQFSDRSARLIAGEIGARIVTLDPLARDWPAGMRIAASAFAEALAPPNG